MGELVQLDGRQPTRLGPDADRAPSPTATLWFDLASPATYLVVERVERTLADVAWRPAVARRPDVGLREDDPRARAAFERRASELRLPLVWPERFPAAVPTAMRAATFAAEEGRAAQFAIAATRLAFCGGYDLEDPSVVAEAAAAACLDVAAALAAAADARRDRLVEEAVQALEVAGDGRLPALALDGAMHCGEQGIAAALGGAGAPGVHVRPRAS